MNEHRALDLIQIGPKADAEIIRSKVEYWMIGNFNVGTGVAGTIETKRLPNLTYAEARAVNQRPSAAITDNLFDVGVAWIPKSRVVRHGKTLLTFAGSCGVVDGPNV